jgi:Protein of unknown function (DUF1425)
MLKRLTLLSVVVLLAAGCQVNPPIQGRADPYVPAQVHLATDELRNDTAVGTPIVTRNESDLLVVTVPIRSAVNLTLHVDYRVTFFDRNHQTIGTYGWFPKTLEANTPDQIKVNSTSTQAYDFQVDVRYSR